MKFVPIRDKILVKRSQEFTKTPGGLFIPQTSQEKPSEGEVLAVGSGNITKSENVVPFTVKPGDKIYFLRGAGTEIKIEGEEYLVLREEHILGVVGL